MKRIFILFYVALLSVGSPTSFAETSHPSKIIQDLDAEGDKAAQEADQSYENLRGEWKSLKEEARVGVNTFLEKVKEIDSQNWFKKTENWDVIVQAAASDYAYNREGYDGGKRYYNKAKLERLKQYEESPELVAKDMAAHILTDGYRSHDLIFDKSAGGSLSSKAKAEAMKLRNVLNRAKELTSDFNEAASDPIQVMRDRISQVKTLCNVIPKDIKKDYSGTQDIKTKKVTYTKKKATARFDYKGEWVDITLDDADLKDKFDATISMLEKASKSETPLCISFHLDWEPVQCILVEVPTTDSSKFPAHSKSKRETHE